MDIGYLPGEFRGPEGEAYTPTWDEMWERIKATGRIQMRDMCKYDQDNLDHPYLSYRDIEGVHKGAYYVGFVEERHGQRCVFCAWCGKFQYNQPKTEAQVKPRVVSSVRADIKPKQRYQVIERAGRRCELCGKSSTVLHVGHILSVAEGLEQGLSPEQLNDPENLIAECEECNLGQGRTVLPLWLAATILRARSR